MKDHLEAAAESVLFAAAEPVRAKLLATALEADEAQVPGIIEALRKQLAGRGIMVVQLAGGYQLSTRPEFAEYVRRFREPEPQRLSRSALETLTIIAYRQPITRPEIEAIRGVDSSHVLTSLQEKGLVHIIGRKVAPGRPVLYATTDHFLSVFGLASLGDLPELDPLRRAQIGQLDLPEDQPSGEAEAIAGGRKAR